MVLAGRFVKARRLFGVCRGSVTSPMMGDRRVIRRTCPSSVALLRDELTHALTDSNLFRSRCEVNFTYAQGGGGVRWPGSILHRSPQGGVGELAELCKVREMLSLEGACPSAW